MLEIDTEDVMIVFSNEVTPRDYKGIDEFLKKHHFDLLLMMTLLCNAVFGCMGLFKYARKELAR